ncbi:YceD family protein [Litoreibacter roseus]|uniref:DUF177 domain-containing protein n=1 Tax=Litoreibacter roseus TaxID=2601869 RepID=A0A6N6JBI5_9RHOB|nr:DUF177 domain-containing protein [Litoreibacter roseus]GFE63621.1 hypothetical protein KIN_06950 [Litoreibacter roseus]
MNARFRVSKLSQSTPTSFEYRPDKTALTNLALALKISGVRKLSFQGSISATGKADWHLKGRLGATVVQSCVVTLEPVTTRIEDEVERFFVQDWIEPEDTEVEMPEDDRTEPLGTEIDVAQVAQEALALALPLYPRAEGADLGEAVFTEPGTDALTDEDTKPFAGLADLKKQLENKN